MKVHINGQSHTLDQTSLLDFINAQQLDPKCLIAELNGVIIPQEEYGQIHLAEGDRVEFLTLVGGG